MSAVERKFDIFKSRLQSLSAILDRAEAELASDVASQTALLGARLAPDMLPFPYQIAFTCRQPALLLCKLNGETFEEIDIEALNFGGLKALVKKTIANIDAADACEKFAVADTELEIPGFPTLSMSGQDYMDDWLMPNFYFHFVTAYDILRKEGLELGKGDYMSHLRPRLAAAGAGD